MKSVDYKIKNEKVSDNKNMRLQDILASGEAELEVHKIAEAKLDAWYLFEDIFQMNRATYFMNMHQEAEEEKIEKYQRAIHLRSKHIPLQHITGTQEFMGLSFEVNENVLIPRQDTECLVERVMEYAKDKDVLDVCTGSGCIIISLEKLAEIKSATAVDISKEALKVAQRNAMKLNAKIKFVESDLFSHVQEKYDIIVSNPPYIPTKVIDGLMEEVKNHEPMLALDGKEDGLYFYRRIIEEAPKYLTFEGMLFFEIGHDQGVAVSNLMKERGFEQVCVEKDLAGLDRVVYGKLNLN